MNTFKDKHSKIKLYGGKTPLSAALQKPNFRYSRTFIKSLSRILIFSVEWKTTFIVWKCS
jgi:hypothetical protein